MGDSDWPMQKGELTHRVPRGWIENDQCSGSGHTEGWARWSWPEITNGAGNVSRPDVSCLPPAETDSQADSLWFGRSGISSFSDTCVPRPAGVRIHATEPNVTSIPGSTRVIPPATVGVSRQTASENAPAVMEGGLRRQSHALRKVVRAREGEIAGVVEYHGNVAAAIGMNGSEVGVLVVPATGIYDVEVQIIAFRARKIGSKAESRQGEPW